MRKADSAKTAWVRKVTAGILLIAVALASIGLYWSHHKPCADNVRTPSGECLILETVTTPAAQAKGLGGRASLPADAGMLFVLPKEDPQCFWMKDMRFDLDILWLNKLKHVMHIERNLSPKTYPMNFCPPSPAKYVIEVNGGYADAHLITDGTELKF